MDSPARRAAQVGEEAPERILKRSSGAPRTDRPRALGLLLALGATLGASAWAAPPPSPERVASAAVPEAQRVEGLTFYEALSAATQTPESLAQSAAVRAQRGLARALSGWTEHPELEILPGWRFAQRGEGRPEWAVTLSQGLHLSGLADARAEAVRAEGRALHAWLDAEQLERRLALARVWIDAHSAEAAYGLAERAVQRGLALEARVQRAVEAGALTQDALMEVRLECAQLRFALREREAAVRGARLALAHRLPLRDWGPAGGPRPEGALPEPALPEPAQWPALIERSARLPAAGAAKLSARAAQARAAEAQAEEGLRLRVGLSVQSDEDDTLLMGIVGLSLPVTRAQQHVHTRAQTEQRLAEAEALGAAQSARTELAQTLHVLQSTEALLRQIEAEILPAAQDLVAHRARALSLGAGLVFDSLRAEAQWAQFEAQRVHLQGERAWAALRAWVLLDALETASSAEDGARTAEDGARTAEDGARTAADGARTAEDGARTAADGAQTPEDTEAP